MKHHFLILLGLLVLSLSACTAPVRVEWDTETEMNTAGFNLYRAESPEGPFTMKVNDSLIAASPDPLTGGKYEYIDRTARVGRTYYYRLQEVERDGQLNNYGPIAVKAGTLTIWAWALGGISAIGVVALWIWSRRRAAQKQQTSHDGG